MIGKKNLKDTLKDLNNPNKKFNRKMQRVSNHNLQIYKKQIDERR